MPESGLKQRILFVDDEPQVTAGLERTLRSMRHEWQMQFVNSGAEALQALESAPFDVIVTDMRMPCMSGAQLLTQALKRYPLMIRIMLSGHSDQEAILQAVGPTHHFLAKPCDIHHLKATVAKACALHELLTSPTLQRMVTEMEMLPCLPALYAEMMEAAQMPDATVQSIGSVIARDMGMTAKMLQLVNSAFFGLPRSVTSAIEAVTLLGLETARALVLSCHAFAQFDVALLPMLSAESLWKHSLRVGELAKRIAQSENSDRRLCEDAYTAGLLHDCGRLALATNLPSLYATTLELAQRENLPLIEAEMVTLNATHAQVGAYLMGLWGLPPAIVEALAFHHRPADCRTGEFSPLTAVYVANCLENAAHPGDVIGVAIPIEDDYLAGLGLAERVTKWQEIHQQMRIEEEKA